MDAKRLLRLYDESYAADYSSRFLTSNLAKSDAEHEVRLLATLLQPGGRWLDVACGTGFFLSRFPECEREGLDLSPSMLALARKANPGVTFHLGNFLDERPEWRNHWDLVSCMWYAYGLVESMEQIEKLVDNLASWTSPGGQCFVPLADPRLIAGVDLPHIPASPWPGRVSIDAILWSYSEDDGAKVHEFLIAPQVEHMQMLFSRHFAVVELATYPPPMPGSRRALIASRKRA